FGAGTGVGARGAGTGVGARGAAGALCRTPTGAGVGGLGVTARLAVPIDAGAGPEPGPPMRVTSEELASVTDMDTPADGPSGSSSERGFFTPSAPFSPPTTRRPPSAHPPPPPPRPSPTL